VVPNILYGLVLGVIWTEGTGLDWTDLVPWYHAVYVKDVSGVLGGGLNKRMQLLVAFMLIFVTMGMSPNRRMMVEYVLDERGDVWCCYVPAGVIAGGVF